MKIIETTSILIFCIFTDKFHYVQPEPKLKHILKCFLVESMDLLLRKSKHHLGNHLRQFIFLLKFSVPEQGFSSAKHILDWWKLGWVWRHHQNLSKLALCGHNFGYFVGFMGRCVIHNIYQSLFLLVLWKS